MTRVHKFLILCGIMFSISVCVFAQPKLLTDYSATNQSTLNSQGWLSQSQINQLFNQQIKYSLGITYEIKNAYPYSDVAGSYYMLFMADRKGGVLDDKTNYVRLKVLNVESEDGFLLKEFELNDVVEPDETYMEYLFPYIFVGDIDNDGYADQIIAYRTYAKDGISYDGRIKIIIYSHKKAMGGIRFKSSKVKEEQLLQVDPEFYKLPQLLRLKAIETLLRMEADQIVVLPSNWQTGITKQRSIIW